MPAAYKSDMARWCRDARLSVPTNLEAEIAETGYRHILAINGYTCISANDRIVRYVNVCVVCCDGKRWEIILSVKKSHAIHFLTGLDGGIAVCGCAE